MVCFFKSIDTFETIGQAVVSDYAVPLASANGATGSVTVPGELTQDYTRQWLILGDQLLYITAVTPQDNMTTITVGDTLSAFNRTIAYEEPTTYYLGEYIKSLAESEYINQSDPYFDMPYLTATNSDTTEFAHVEPNDNITSLETVARGAQAQGVSIVFSFDADSVTMAISTASTTAQSVVMGDGHSELIEETYNRELISKVTVISVMGYPHYYYKTLTGEIVTEAPVNRPPGEWVTVLQNSDLNLLDTAKAAFAASVNSHKIVFYSSVDLSLFQYLRVRLNGKVYDTQVTYKGIQALDMRFLYECGDAATTLTDKILALTRATAQVAASIPTAISQVRNDIGAMEFLGQNPISTPANDSPANWVTLGSGYGRYSSLWHLIDQPAAVGMLINYAPLGEYVYQLFITRGGGNVYVRRSNGSSAWQGTWQRLVSESDVYYKTGDTFTISDYTTIPAIVYSTSRRVYLTVVVPKSMANISTVTVTALKGTLVGPAGVLDGSGDNTDWLGGSSYTVDSMKVTDNIVRVRITKSSAISGVTSHMVCGLDANPISLSFS